MNFIVLTIWNASAFIVRLESLLFGFFGINSNRQIKVVNELKLYCSVFDSAHLKSMSC